VFLHEAVVHSLFVGRCDDDGVVGRKRFRGEFDGFSRSSGALRLRAVGVEVVHSGAFMFELVPDFKGGGFPEVVDVALVGDSQEENPASLHGLAPVVEEVLETGDHVGGHLVVDVAGHLDEPGVVVVGTGLPREVVRVDGDAVPSHAGAGVEGDETEGFGGGCCELCPAFLFELKKCIYMVLADPAAAGEGECVHDRPPKKGVEAFPFFIYVQNHT